MRSAALVVPGALTSRTGGYIYDRRITEGLRQRGWTINVHELPDRFPFPDAETLARTDAVLAAIRAGTTTLVDGLAFGAMPVVAERHASRLRLVAIVHLPLAFDPGLDASTAFELEASERRALATARLIVVTGRTTIDLLQQYALPPGRLAVVEPGTDRAPSARGGGSDAVELLCVATLNPGKDHESLLLALAQCTGPWRLTCAGSLTRHPETANRIRALINQLGMASRVVLAGELEAEALEAAYHQSDVFTLATRRETYGMAIAEALARGLPVVSTTTGAIPDLVGNSAGILVTPGDRVGLAGALARVIDNGGLRARLKDGAMRVRDHLPTWDAAAAGMAAALERLEPPSADQTSNG